MSFKIKGIRTYAVDSDEHEIELFYLNIGHIAGNHSSIRLYKNKYLNVGFLLR